MRRVKGCLRSAKMSSRLDVSLAEYKLMNDEIVTAEHAPAPNAQSGFSGADIPAYEDYAHCVHCGLCLNHCPTYKLWGLEADSPRGRIRQIVLVDQGRLPLGDSFVKHIDQCLDCRACETACPSGVEYGKLVEAARAQIEQNYQRPFFSRLTRDFVFRSLLPYPKRIALLARLLYVYQRSGLQSLVRTTGILGAVVSNWPREKNSCRRSIVNFSSRSLDALIPPRPLVARVWPCLPDASHR